MSIAQHMDFWFQKPPGSLLLDLEHQHLDNLLSRLPGEALLQMGGPSDLSLVRTSTIPFKLFYAFTELTPTAETPTVFGDLQQLPLRAESFDVVVVAHALAFCPQPQVLFEQLYAALQPGGVLIVLGFNPYSLWQLRRWRADRSVFPWAGQFHAPGSVKRALRAAEFNLIAYRSFCYRYPSIQSQSWQKDQFWEVLGQMLLPSCGGVYMMLAQKQAVGMTPLFSDWREWVTGSSSNVAQPSNFQGKE
jgi:SAM-dependent methyltransferase